MHTPAHPQSDLQPARPGRSQWQDALKNWLQRPHKATAVHTLHQRHIYVLPTRAGWGLLITLLVLLIASINFQLNLGYALTFLVLGSAAASLVWGYRNIYGTTLQVAPLTSVFVGESVSVPVLLQHRNSIPKYSLSLALRNGQVPLAWIHTDVQPGPAQPIHLGWSAEQRGWQRVPSVVIESRYPLGVFRLWSMWQPQAQVLVYPAPETPMPPIQHSESLHSGHGAQPRASSHESDGVRSYQRGDSMRSIAWKKTATALASGSGDMVVREAAKIATHSVWLDAKATGTSHVEVQIARLTAWVLHAHAQQWEWGLTLPSGQQLPPASGDAHLHACLHALAVDGLPHHNASTPSNAG